ncbi:MAG TPA: LamG-like jellyroll fold domain-containing protein, partial [Candidatus Dormibacteraeota bacterium]|nr:LamG-like jellyroll fold domain-containing protein [Candidatus Dormibacteraeota bacterium]
QLIFLIVAPDGTRHRTAVAGILRSNEWFHIAAVSGPGGATLYFNGTLVGTNAWQGSFAGLVGRKNYLGKSNYSSTDPTTPAQMDEVRVWNHARTPEQIRDGMFKPLTGKEPGLVGYWNFDDGTGKDRAPGHRDGKLMGGAKIIEAELPTPETIRRVEAVMLAGRVTDREGRLLSGAAVQVHQDGKSVVTVRTELSGDYQLVFPANRRPYEVRVVWSDLGAARTNVLFFERQTHSWDFVLAETTLSGQLYSRDNQPQAAAKVELLRGPGQTLAAATLTDADGNYHFRIPAPDAYRLRAQTPVGPVLLNDGRAVEMAMGSQMTGMNFEVAVRSPKAPSVTPNRVLQLRETNAYVRLPSQVFSALEEATVEAWI